MSCIDRNNPQVLLWNETGYRLDSVITSGIVFNAPSNYKAVYYYSISSLKYDSFYTYSKDCDQWILYSKETFKYDEKWNVAERIRSLYDNSNKWIPESKESYKYDAVGNVTELNSSKYENSKWISYSAEYSDYNGKNCSKRTFIFYSQGEEAYRNEYQYEYDSLGYVVFETHENYLRGSFSGYYAAKHEYYYTRNRVDSVYHYSTNDKQVPLECNNKAIYIKNEENYNEILWYNYKDEQFILT